MGNILLSVVSAIAIVHSLGKKGTFQKIITIGLSLSVLAFWFDQKEIKLIAILSFSIFTLLTVIPAILTKNIESSLRLSLLSMGLCLPFYLLFKVEHWPIETLEYFTIYSAATTLWPMTKKKIIKSKEFGLFLIIAMMNIIQVIKMY